MRLQQLKYPLLTAFTDCLDIVLAVNGDAVKLVT